MAEAAEVVTAPEPAAAVDPPASAPESAAPESVDALPEWAQRHIRKARSEAKDSRVKAEGSVQALEATKAAILKAFGVGDQEDPVAVAKTATEQREAAQLVAKNLATENAVLRAALKAGANPEALTDSRSFMDKLTALDPAADDFAAQVNEAIAKAIEANPALRAGAPTPARSGGPVAGGVPAGKQSDDPQQRSRDYYEQQAAK